MKKIKILYILGTSRCGSTMLSNLLGLVPGFISVGELRYIWERGFIEDWLCSCGQLFNSCAFWKNIVKEAFGEVSITESKKLMNIDLQIRRNVYRRKMPSLESSDIVILQEYLRKLYTAIRVNCNCDVIVDSSKGVGYAYILNHISDFDLYFLHLVRDSRAITYSRLKRKKVIPKAFGNIKKMGTGLNIFAIIEDWNRTNKLAEKYFSANEKYLFIKYEDFVSDPINYLNIILRLLKINRFKFNDLNELSKTDEMMHIFSGNPNRFTGDYTNIKVDDMWKKNLSFFHKQMVKLGTNTIMKKYHYS